MGGRDAFVIVGVNVLVRIDPNPRRLPATVRPRFVAAAGEAPPPVRYCGGMAKAVGLALWRVQALRQAAASIAPVSGLTHRFYRYPARFSPTFAGAAIDALSRPGDMVMDPFMGGGTVVVEALVRGRRAVGSDINSLSAFLARVKTCRLTEAETTALEAWANQIVPDLSYRSDVSQTARESPDPNLSLPLARPIRKLCSVALHSIATLPSLAGREFARCALLNVAQLALNGRRTQMPLHVFRRRLKATVQEMLDGSADLASALDRVGGARSDAVLLTGPAAALPTVSPFSTGDRADLVVTSPPYPGVHILYHRWQVDGRRESPAPYWIAGCEDSRGFAAYNFADRRSVDLYFERALIAFKGIRGVVKDGAFLVQLMSFGDPKSQLPRYLSMLKEAGFDEIRAWPRVWRRVPGRRWHAAQKGASSASREVLLLHRAV